MTFNELLKLVSTSVCTRICVDSRLVKDGDIFIAVKGTVYDGHDFIDQAIDNGAKYIVCQNDRRQKTEDRRQNNYEITSIEDSAKAAAILAQTVRGNPASQLTNLAVTGTNGKTTVAYLVRSVLQYAGQRCGLIGTVEYDTGLSVLESSLTTPDCLEIARIQQQMVKAGCKYMIIEASSHALSQNRLAGIEFKAAAFTNLAGDHIDYHKTQEDYLAAKAKLFSSLSPDAIAVLNKQSPEAEIIAEKTKANILWYAIDEPADITAHIESMDIDGTVFTLEYAGQTSLVPRPLSLVKTPLLGRYNVSNHLAAAGLCLAAGFDLQTISAGLSALQIIPGRLEKIKWNLLTAESNPAINCGAKYLEKGDFSVFIDYAHTDDALRNVLATLKPLCKGRLIVVFGCGGDRDRTKRPRMAKVAEELADIIIVTSDNPRTEKPEDIIDEIVAGFDKGLPIRSKELRNTQYAIRNTKIIEPDRRKAIELAIRRADRDDIVLIAGKGHENYQIIGTQKFDFSDKAIAEQLLRKRE
jgi:UDP-N-acetylmuramoyl-L-alanyl-D-glutamate--2,6-diaminopimelate ligase